MIGNMLQDAMTYHEAKNFPSGGMPRVWLQASGHLF